MTTCKNTFFELLLQVEEPSSAEYQSVLESVTRNPSQTKIDEETQQRLFLDLDKVVIRLKLFLGKLSRGPRIIMKKEIADEIILNILQPIISYASPELDRPETVIGVLLCVLPSISSCSNKTQEALLKALSETNSLPELLITDPKSSRAVKNWMANHDYNPRAPSVLRKLAKRFMTLCEKCTYDHGTSTLLGQWQDLSKLIDYLEQQNVNFEQHQTNNLGKARDIRHLGGSILLEEQDKKSGRGQSSLSTPAPQVLDDISRSLADLNMVYPTSLRQMETALDRLRIDETRKVLISAMETFPCRPCNELACNPDGDHSSARPKLNRAQLTDQSVDPEIFARRMGAWKVILSAQAVRDMKKLSHSGMS